MGTFSDQQLKDSSFHLAYEIEMFVLTGQLCVSGAFGSGRVQSAILEAFLVHFRILYDFLFATPKNDDIVARHYAGNWQSSEQAELAKLRKQANKCLAHLTASRNDFSSILWPIAFMLNEIVTFLRDFAGMIDRSKAEQHLLEVLNNLPNIGPLQPVLGHYPFDKRPPI